MKTAWVISGGGAKGAQALALIVKHLRAGNPLPDYICGTSAGGLLSISIAHLGIQGTINEFWKITKRKDVFSTPFFKWESNLGYWSAKPLQERIKNIIESKKPTIPYHACAHDFTRKKTVYFTYHDGYFKLSATACMPFIVSPIIVPGEGGFEDGAVSENVPLKKAIQAGADTIHVFMCSAKSEPSYYMPRNIFEKTFNTIESIMAENARNDFEACLHKNTQEGYKKIDLHVHYPERNELTTLDFDKMREYLRRHI